MVSQNVQPSAQINGTDQPYAPLMKNKFSFRFLNMKPSSEAGFNDPVVTTGSGIIDSHLTPAANMIIQAAPTRFDIIDGLVPKGKRNGITNNTPNAFRVRGFVGFITQTLTFTGSLPVAWPKDAGMIIENADLSKPYRTSQKVIQSRKITHQGKAAGEVTLASTA